LYDIKQILYAHFFLHKVYTDSSPIYGFAFYSFFYVLVITNNAECCLIRDLCAGLSLFFCLQQFCPVSVFTRHKMRVYGKNWHRSH